MPIVTFGPDLIEPLCSLYNSEGAFSPFIAHLTPKLFQRRIAAKAFFDTEGVFVATSGPKVTGAIFTAFAPSSDKSGFDVAKGVIDGLFFSESRPRTGDALLARALSYLESRGVRSVVGWATAGEYPFWRDLYCGSEPVMHAAAKHVFDAFIRAGFTKCQHSVALLAKVKAARPALDRSYSIHNAPAPTDSFWGSNTWLDLSPVALHAEVDGVKAGSLGWCPLPATSRRRGVRTAGVYSVFVEESFRRRGVASALLERCFADAARDGAEEILLATTIENTAALATYRKFGFTEVFDLIGTQLERL